MAYCPYCCIRSRYTRGGVWPFLPTPTRGEESPRLRSADCGLRWSVSLEGVDAVRWADCARGLLGMLLGWALEPPPEPAAGGGCRRTGVVLLAGGGSDGFRAPFLRKYCRSGLDSRWKTSGRAGLAPGVPFCSAPGTKISSANIADLRLICGTPVNLCLASNCAFWSPNFNCVSSHFSCCRATNDATSTA